MAFLFFAKPKCRIFRIRKGKENVDNESIYALILFPCVLIMCVSLMFVISGNKKKDVWIHQSTVTVSLWATFVLVFLRLYADWNTRLVFAYFALMLILAGTIFFYYREYGKYKKAKKKAGKTKVGRIWESDDENRR